MGGHEWIDEHGELQSAVVWAADQLRAGRTVLVRAQPVGPADGSDADRAGPRRAHSDWTGARGRSESALNNTIFVDYLTTGLSVSSLLSGLGV